MSSMQSGALDKYGVELLGAKLPSINRAEDRSLFKDAMKKIGLKTPESGIANNMEEALAVTPASCCIRVMSLKLVCATELSCHARTARLTS